LNNETELSLSKSRISAFISDGNYWRTTDPDNYPIKCINCGEDWIPGGEILENPWLRRWRNEEVQIFYSPPLRSYAFNNTLTFDFPIAIYQKPVDLGRQTLKQDFWLFFNLKRPLINSLRILEISNGSKFS